jgi:hypothetical protein
VSGKVVFSGVEQGQGEWFARAWLVREAEARRRLALGVDVALPGGEEQAGDGEEFGMGDSVQPAAGVPGVSGADETQPVLPLAGQGGCHDQVIHSSMMSRACW